MADDGVLGELLVLITGNASGLISAFQEGSAASQEAEEKISTHTGKMAAGMQAMAAAAAAYIAVEAVKSFAEFIESVVEGSMEGISHITLLAAEFGVTSEAMDSLKVAGAEVGLSIDSVAGSMKLMENNLAKAAEGTGTAVAALSKLGLSAEDLAELKPDEQMRAIADAFTGLSTQADKASVATGLFGRQGIQMINILDGGAKGFDAAQEKAAKFNQELNATDSAQVYEAAKAIVDVQLAFEGLANVLTVALAPYITSISKQLVDMVVGAQNWGETFKNAIGGVLQFLDYLNTGWQEGQKAWAGFEVAVNYLALGVVQLGQVFDVIFESIYNVLTAFGKYTEDINEVISASFRNVWDMAGNYVKEFVAAAGVNFGNLITLVASAMQAAHMKGAADVQELGLSIHATSTALASAAEKDNKDVAKSWASLGDEATLAGKQMADAWNAPAKSSDFMQKLVDAQTAALANAQANWQKILDKPLDLHAWAEWGKSVVAIAQSTAEQVTQKTTSGANTTADAQIAADRRYLNSFFSTKKQEEAEENANYQRDLARAKAAEAATHTSQAQSAAINEQINQNHAKNMANIDDGYFGWLLDEQEVTDKQRETMATSLLGSLASMMSSHNKRMFEIGKAASYAETVISTGKAAMNAYSAMAGITLVGPVLGALAAAAAIAYGASQLSSIASTSFEGGGSPGGAPSSSVSAPSTASPSASGATSSLPGSGVPGQGGAAGVTIVLQGQSGFTAQQIRDMIGQINTQASNGATLVTVNQK